MESSNLNVLARKLAGYIESINELSELPAMEAYHHMGALLTDAILQAGINYQTVVLPKVQNVQSFTEAATTSGFLKLLEREGVYKLLNWSHPEKPERLLTVTRFFYAENIETTDDLRIWLQNKQNITRLKQLKGIGDKTADYFKILVGLSTSAIDTHIFKFLENAGTPAHDYHEAQILLHEAANIIKMDYAVLDHNIWKYMSSSKKKEANDISVKANRSRSLCHKK